MPDEPPVAAVESSPASLEYHPSPLARTRWVRLIIFVLIALVIAALMPRMWTEFGYRVGRRAVQNDFMAFNASKDTLAYDEVGLPHWRSGMATIARPIDIKSLQAPAWQAQWNMAGYFPGSESTLFLHECTSAIGNSRIVGVALMTDFEHAFDDVGPQPMKLRVATAEIIPFRSSSTRTPQIWSDEISVGHWPNGSKARTKFYAGQLDPHDPSRFTIVYQFGEECGTLEGRLNDDATLTLTVKDGPLLSQ